MLEQFFNSPLRIQALRNGPSGSLLDSFAQELVESGCVAVGVRVASLLPALSVTGALLVDCPLNKLTYCQQLLCFVHVEREPGDQAATGGTCAA
jgi:hypothetical protein